MCGKKKSRRNREDTLLTCDLSQAIAGKKDAHSEILRSSTDENKNMFKSMKI